MVLQVEITSKDTIKPSSPTPPHLQSFKLSVLDQLSSSSYINFLLFYPAPSPDHKNLITSDSLKNTLAKTLTHLYPLAGRLHEDGCSIICNDEGAVFYEARVYALQKQVLEKAEAKELKKLLPPCTTSTLCPSDALLALQFSSFICGAKAIGVLLSHRAGDGAALATFLKFWSDISTAGVVCIQTNAIVDGTSLFPPVDAMQLSAATHTVSVLEDEDESVICSNYMSKRFVFDGEKLKRLREEVSKCIRRQTNTDKSDYCSKVIAVSTHIWGSIIRTIHQQKLDDYTKSERMHYALHCVDLRKRMIPPLPQHSLGNISEIAIGANWANKRDVDYGGVAIELRDAITNINDEFVRRFHQGNMCFNIMTTKPSDGFNADVYILFSSLCKFPFYEIDLGWGKPIWAATNIVVRNRLIVSFLDTKSGQGIEAWINMLAEDMAILEADPEFLAYVSNCL